MRVPVSVLRMALRRPALAAAVRSPAAAPTLPAMTLTPSSHSAFSFSSSFSTSAIALKKGGKEKKSPAKADKPAKGDKGGKGKGKKDEGEDEAGGLTPEEIDAVVEKATARMDKSLEWAKTSVFDGVERGRGRVTPAILDGVKVALPDQGLVPLKSVASVTVKANVLTVDVWDSSALKHVESAIHKANLPGISPQRDTTAIRIPVARPTGDVRREILKQLHETLEAAKGQIRIARTDALKALGGRGEEGTDDVQKATDRVSGEIDKLQQSAKKELEK